MEDLSKYEQRILDYLYANDKEINTNKISTDTGIDWSTTYTHCCHLLSRRMIDTMYTRLTPRSQSKQVWFISKAGMDHMLKYIAGCAEMSD